MSDPKNKSSSDEARLLAMLTEDIGSTDDVNAVLPLIVQIRNSPTNILNNSRIGQVSQQAVVVLRTMHRGTRLERFRDWYPILLLKAQLRIVQGEIWVASAFIMIIGVMVTLLMSFSRPASADLPLVLVAPIVAATGISFLYGTDVEQALEIEQATLTSPQIILLLRVMLVFAFDFALGVISSLVLTLVSPSYSLTALIMTWFAPMAFLSALAFLMSIVFGDAGVGTVTSLILWTFQALSRFLAQNGSASLPVPDLLSASSQVWLLICVIPLLVSALWLVEHKNWTIRRPQ